MSSHEIDLVGFVGGVFLLICAAGAIGIRTGSLGLGDAPSGAWIAGGLLLLVGLMGLVGSLASTRRRAVASDDAELGTDELDGDPERDETPEPVDL